MSKTFVTPAVRFPQIMHFCITCKIDSMFWSLLNFDLWISRDSEWGMLHCYPRHFLRNIRQSTTARRWGFWYRLVIRVLGFRSPLQPHSKLPLSHPHRILGPILALNPLPLWHTPRLKGWKRSIASPISFFTRRPKICTFVVFLLIASFKIEIWVLHAGTGNT